MSASSFGTKNEPKFAEGDAPDLAVNPTQVAAYAAKVGNRRVGTTAERTAATGKDVWEGLLWGDTSTGGEYRYTSGAWVLRGNALLAAKRLPGILDGALLSTTYTTRLSVTVDTFGQQVIVEWTANTSNGNSGGTRQATHAIFCDGVQVDDASKIHLSNGNPYRGTDAGMVMHTPAAGSHTYELKGAADQASSVLGFNASIRVFG